MSISERFAPAPHAPAPPSAGADDAATTAVSKSLPVVGRPIAVGHARPSSLAARERAPARASFVSRLLSQLVCRSVAAVYDAALVRFPRVVRVETTNACNARCTICPHASLQRPIERMSDALFAEVLDECAAAGCREMHLHNFGEPLLDKGLEDRVRQAKAQGIAKVKIFSNGSLLSEDRAERLLAAGLDEIKISFDGATAEEFERIRRPLKFDAVVENIQRLVRLRNAAGSPMKIHVACCSTSDKQGTMAALERSVDGFSFGRIHNWASDDAAPPVHKVRKPCSRIWRTLTILASGEVALCCLDYDGQHILGRVGDGPSLADIWRGAAYRRVRELHTTARQDEIALCRTCTKAFL